MGLCAGRAMIEGDRRTLPSLLIWKAGGGISAICRVLGRFDKEFSAGVVDNCDLEFGLRSVSEESKADVFAVRGAVIGVFCVRGEGVMIWW